MGKITLESKKGITLIALVVTIIVLLILVSVTMILLIGNNGIVQKVKEAKEETRGGQVQEARDLWKAEMNIDEKTNTNTAKTLKKVLDELVTQELITLNERKVIEETGEVTIGSKTIVFDENIMTPTNVGKFYGKTVKNYTDKKGNSDYQLFYIDYYNKYGDGEGTIYLKKNKSVERWTLSNNSAKYEDTTGLDSYRISEVEKMPNVYAMNQKWRENLTTTPNTQAAKFTSYLCNANNWKEYDESGRKIGGGTVNYAIGGPSIELFVDSINQAIDAQKPELEKFDCKVVKPESSSQYLYGYLVKPAGAIVNGVEQEYYTSTKYSSIPGELANEMYGHKDEVDYQIIASPVDERGDTIFYMNDYNHCISNKNTFSNGSVGATILVSLNSDFKLEFID